jgi:hypothetical protein
MLDSVVKALMPIWYERRERARRNLERLAAMADANYQPQPRERIRIAPLRESWRTYADSITTPAWDSYVNEMRAHRRATNARDNFAARYRR